MPLDFDEIDRNGISYDSSFAEKKGEKTLVYVRNGSEKNKSEIFFYCCMLHQLKKIYQLYLCSCLITLLVPYLPLIRSTSRREENFVKFYW